MQISNTLIPLVITSMIPSQSSGSESKNFWEEFTPSRGDLIFGLGSTIAPYEPSVNRSLISRLFERFVGASDQAGKQPDAHTFAGMTANLDKNGKKVQATLRKHMRTASGKKTVLPNDDFMPTVEVMRTAEYLLSKETLKKLAKDEEEKNRAEGDQYLELIKPDLDGFDQAIRDIFTSSNPYTQNTLDKLFDEFRQHYRYAPGWSFIEAVAARCNHPNIEIETIASHFSSLIFSRMSKGMIDTFLEQQDCGPIQPGPDNACIHFMLDDIRINDVVNKCGKNPSGITAKELRYLYRHRDQLDNSVNFYRGERSVSAPWHEDPALWDTIAKKSLDASPTAASIPTRSAAPRQDAEEKTECTVTKEIYATIEANWKAAQLRRETQPTSLIAAVATGFITNLSNQAAVTQAQKQQSIRQEEQERAIRRELEGQRSRQQRDRARSDPLTVLMRTALAVSPARSNSREAAPSYRNLQSTGSRALGNVSAQALPENDGYTLSPSQNACVPRSNPQAMVRLPSNTQYRRETGVFSAPARAIIDHKTVSGRLSGQVEGNVFIHIPPPDRGNIAVAGPSTDRRPAPREIPMVAGIHNTSDTIAISLRQGQQELNLGAKWTDIKGQKLYFDDQSGEKRITLSPPKTSRAPK